MSSQTFTPLERTILAEVRPRALALRHINERYQGTADRLQVIAASLRAGQDRDSLEYAYAMTEEAYQYLTGRPLPSCSSSIDADLVERFSKLASDRLNAIYGD
ncbi:conserved hypothetical protein [Oceanicaulis sp. 350]|jgi:hypothetical protein|nr:conserved hypothetical protein [Oceanicaulis sp. 350]